MPDTQVKDAVDHARAAAQELHKAISDAAAKSGEPDTTAIKSWVEKVAPVAKDPAAPDLGQGARSGDQSKALNGDPLESALRNKLGVRR